jgi:hypothetical protein
VCVHLSYVRCTGCHLVVWLDHACMPRHDTLGPLLRAATTERYFSKV